MSSDNLNHILSLSKNEIIYNAENLKRYKEIYASFFGHEPNCAPCNFNYDFQQLKNRATNRKFIEVKKTEMKKYTLKKGNENKIFSFRNEEGIFRSYGKDLNDDFVDNFLVYGSGREEERRNLFIVNEVEEEVKVKVKKSKKINNG
jgi:hypothetical protein